MRKKLYLAANTVDVIFTCSSIEKSIIENEAKHFLEAESKNYVPNRFKLKEITSIEEVPEYWKDVIIWGDDKDNTPTSFLFEEDREYQEYLRLKKKFE